MRVLVIITTVFLLFSCKKMHKKANDVIPNSVWEITSLTVDGVEKFEEFYQDSCLCKTMKFTTEKNVAVGGETFDRAYTIYFSDCNGKSILEEFPSVTSYSIFEHSVKKRKWANFLFSNYSQSDSSCTCGRFGYASIFFISSVKKDEVIFEADLPDGRWIVTIGKQ